MLVSLGCNCHPAYWLKKSGLASLSMPFDWLLMPAHLGLDYVVEVYKNSFSDFLDGIRLNSRLHPISEKYPNTELFHHHALLDEDLGKREEERNKLIRRAARFMKLVEGAAAFLYCYPIDVRSNTKDKFDHFSESIDRLLQVFPHSRLFLYFLEDSHSPVRLEFPVHGDRLIIYSYQRNASVNKVWGEKPRFLEDLAHFAS